LWRISEQFHAIAIDTASLEQFEVKRSGSAALGTDRYFTAAQALQSLGFQFAAVEQPQGFVEDGAERFNFGCIGLGSDPALEECHAHS
jgi:hypothetical protein